MSDHPEEQDVRSSARGESAWKEDLERVAERNRAARKEGKQRREAAERARDTARLSAERERMSRLLEKSDRRPASR